MRSGPQLAMPSRMRLVLSRETFRLEEVPPGFGKADLRGIHGVTWLPAERTLLLPSTDAARILRKLATRGVRLPDAEVHAAATRALEQDPMDAFEALVDFGDPRCVPALSRALDAWKPSGRCEICDGLVVLALSSALVALGGEPSDAQVARVEQHVARADAAFRSARLDAHLREDLSESMLIATEAARPKRAGAGGPDVRGDDPSSTRH